MSGAKKTGLSTNDSGSLQKKTTGSGLHYNGMYSTGSRSNTGLRANGVVPSSVSRNALTDKPDANRRPSFGNLHYDTRPGNSSLVSPRTTRPVPRQWKPPQDKKTNTSSLSCSKDTRSVANTGSSRLYPIGRTSQPGGTKPANKNGGRSGIQTASDAGSTGRTAPSVPKGLSSTTAKVTPSVLPKIKASRKTTSSNISGTSLPSQTVSDTTAIIANSEPEHLPSSSAYAEASVDNNESEQIEISDITGLLAMQSPEFSNTMSFVTGNSAALPTITPPSLSSRSSSASSRVALSPFDISEVAAPVRRGSRPLTSLPDPPVRNTGTITVSHTPVTTTQSSPTAMTEQQPVEHVAMQASSQPQSPPPLFRPSSGRQRAVSEDEAYARNLLQEEMATVEEEDERLAQQLSNNLDTANARFSNLQSPLSDDEDISTRRQRSHQFLRDLFTLMQPLESETDGTGVISPSASDASEEGATAAPPAASSTTPIQSLLQLSARADGLGSGRQGRSDLIGLRHRASGESSALRFQQSEDLTFGDVMQNPMLLLLLLMQTHSQELSAHEALESNDYESLWNLAERLGEVTKRGISEEEICKIPSYELTLLREDPGNQCRVCLTDYSVGDMLRTLPCQHEFHTWCIDQWLKVNATCPICRDSLIKS